MTKTINSYQLLRVEETARMLRSIGENQSSTYLFQVYIRLNIEYNVRLEKLKR